MAKVRVWQIAGGIPDRDYTGLMMKYGVAILGPGDPGEYTTEPGKRDKKYDFLRDPNKSRCEVVDRVRRFAQEVREGDLVLLRLGSEPRAVGVFTSAYKWREEFSDILGWDLQHTRRVKWMRIEDIERKLPAVARKVKTAFQTKKQKRKTTFCGFYDLDDGTAKELLELVKREGTKGQDFKIGERITLDNMRDWLLGSKSASDGSDDNEKRRAREWLSGRISELVSVIAQNELRYADWRRTEQMTEADTIAYSVRPLLKALGWGNEQIVNEHGKVDVAVVPFPLEKEQKPWILIEAKSFNSAIFGRGPLKQLLEYLEDLRNRKGETPCILAISCGTIWLVYDADTVERLLKQKKEAKEKDDVPPDGYINLARLRQWSVDKDGNRFRYDAAQTLYRLSPAYYLNKAQGDCGRR